MRNSDRFLNAFNSIEQYLRKITGMDTRCGFYHLVKEGSKKNSIIKHFAIDLNEFRELRNAIVHNKRDEEGYAIAEPNDQAIREIELIRSYLLDPPRVIPLFQKKVFALPSNETISRALEFMYTHSYSQIPIMSGGSMDSLLSSHSIARWLGANMEKNFLTLKDTTIKTVLGYAEEDFARNFRIVKDSTTLFDVRELFWQFQDNGEKLEAVLITRNGGAAEELLGIITHWDLQIIHRILNKTEG